MEKNKKKKRKKKQQKNVWLEGVSETGRNLVGKGQSENLDIPAAVHMKLISLKKPRLTFFSSPLSPCLHLGEADESAFCPSDVALL